ncbi:GNAT family N-acetyltransferase [Sphingomonas prati]|uniref:Putative N-acetyltransferase YhbS n=1 Tax=Sphingomonas prati TaxID=1843237 RepID=A0A7W9BPR8_9SPHN|nr:N-acetyltransferase [Sphingomonas prati]MBB5727897.1 putative N-acetyltransferase YhbS [Sphingomonas prati]GGE81675.1 GCN5 family N-acetyltransferase [Sphingomonas prati]
MPRSPALSTAPPVAATALLPLRLVDPAAVEALLDTAFGPDRHGRTAYRLRNGVDWLPAQSFAVVQDDRLVGSVQCWPVALFGDDGTVTPLTLLGPVAVDPAHQAGGLGKRLTRAAIHAIVDGHAPPPVLIGDPGYYGRFGFVAEPTQGWDLPGPFERHRLLVLPLSTKALPARGMIGPAFASPPDLP